MYIFERYNHWMYLVFCWYKHRERENVNLLRPNRSFYFLTKFLAFYVAWLFSVFMASIIQDQRDTIQIGLVIALSLPIGLMTSCCACVMIYFFNYFYSKNIRAAFERAKEDNLTELDMFDDDKALKFDFGHYSMYTQSMMSRANETQTNLLQQDPDP